MPAVSRAQIYDFKTYTVSEGMLSNSVTRISQESNAYLWIGTGVAPGMTLRLFRNAIVPGGVVKYEMVSQNKDVYSCELNSYGSGARTELGSY